jgi:hypothetical protein
MTSVIAAPPRVRLQPPNVYPAREVVATLDKGPAEATPRESISNLGVTSSLGEVAARELPSNTIVGFVDVFAQDGGASRPPVRIRLSARAAAALFPILVLDVVPNLFSNFSS